MKPCTEQHSKAIAMVNLLAPLTPEQKIMRAQVFPCTNPDDCKCSSSFMDFHIDGVYESIVADCVRTNTLISNVTDARICEAIAVTADSTYMYTRYCTTRQRNMCGQIRFDIDN